MAKKSLLSDTSKDMIKNVLRKHFKRIISVIILAFSFVVLIAVCFWGTISNIYDKVSKEFADVLDNIEINGNNLEINQDYLSEAMKRIENMGVDASTLGLTGNEDYLERFLEAEIVTNYPYLGGDGLQGTVYFERAKIDGSTTELQYISYDEFYAMQEAGNSELYNYFTIDTEDWTVHVGKNSAQNSFEIEKINYKNMVEKFSMPFEFTIALAMTSQNPQFALAVVNLVKDSRIVVTIAESKTTTTTNTIESWHLERIIRDLETDEEEVINNDMETTAEPDISESYYTTVFLSRANTWILNQITDFSYEDTGDVYGEPQVEYFDDSSETVTTETSEITSTMSNRKRTTIVTTRQQRWNQGQSKVIEKTSNFTNLILRDTNTVSGQGLLGVAKTCHDYLVDNGYTYEYEAGHRGEFPNIESIRSIDCSAYVSWVLYKAGYEDIGAQSSSTLINYANQKGWDIINSINDLKPGDIIIYTGHTNILVAIEGDKYLCYDCGYTEAVQARDPIEYNVSEGFQYALRPNDEIIQALEPETITDLKDTVQEYIDGITEGTYQVRVQNLDRSSNNSFTIGSGKIKSEGWLKLFIMATAYNEVKEGNIEESAVSADIDRMITTDSNDATNALLTTLGEGDIEEGIDKVNDYLDRQNYNGTNLEEQLSTEVGSAGSDENYTTIANVSNLLQKIYKNKCINREYSQKMMEVLKRQLLIEYIPSAITQGEVANKTGDQMNILQDAAIVSIENANYLLVVSATDVTNKAEAGRRIADISRIVNSYFVENGSVDDNSDNFEQDDELDIIMNGRRVCYKVPDAGYQCPLDNLVDAHEMLFELLGSVEKTQNHENLMRYLLYLLTGDSYGVEEFNFEEFVNGSFGSTGIYGNTIQEKVWFALRSLGYSEISVAGAMGNIHHESGGFNPDIVENGGAGEGIGLIQWSFGRRTALENYAASKGVSWQDVDTQIEFLITEISGQGAAIGYATQRTAGYIGDEGITSTHEDWKNATSIEDATLYFMRYFESPRSKSSLSTRTEWAWTYYNEFKGRTAPAGSQEGWSTKGVSCPRYYQNDARWKDIDYKTSGGTLGENGCGACALAMAVSGLTGQEVTPDVIVEYLNSLNLDTVYNGAASAQAVANKYGLTYEKISRSDRSSINAALDAGKCCIFSINGNGIYIGAGHFIMCNGREGDQYYVLESGHYYQTDVGYTFNQVFSPGKQGVFVLGK